MPVEVEFIKEAKVNRATVSVGTKLKFTENVAQSYIDAGVAIKYIPPVVVKSKKKSKVK